MKVYTKIYLSIPHYISFVNNRGDNVDSGPDTLVNQPVPHPQQILPSPWKKKKKKETIVQYLSHIKNISSLKRINKKKINKANGIIHPDVDKKNIIIYF